MMSRNDDSGYGGRGGTDRGSGSAIREARAVQKESGMNKRVALPPPVAAIYRAVAELEALYKDRKFTPDGHLVGSIGEVVAAEALHLTLHPMSRKGHDAFDSSGDVQIKMTAGKRVTMADTCDRLVVLQVVSPEEAEIVYDGPGAPAWAAAGKENKNGRSVSIATLRRLAESR